MGAPEGRGFGFAQGAEFAGAAFDCCGGDLIGHRGGFSTGAGGVGENVEVGEGMALDEVESGGVIGFGFAGEAGDDVGAQGGVRKAVAD